MNSSQKRVLHVLSGMNRGGAETMVMNLYRKMDKSKVQFDFLTYRNDPCAYDEEILSLGGRLFLCPEHWAKQSPYICEECEKRDKRKWAVQRRSCAHGFPNGFYRPCGKASRSAGQGMPLPQYVLEDRLQLEGSIAAARVQAAHFGKCDSAVCLRRGCGQVFIWTVQYGAEACSPSS